MGTPFKSQNFEKLFFFHSRENKKKQSQSQIFMSLQGPQMADISVNNRKGYGPGKNTTLKNIFLAC